MNVKKVFFITLMLFLEIIVLAVPPAVLVHNTNQEIQSCQGKLKLKIIRTWGGSEEQDENKFFKYPADIKIDKYLAVYICDLYNYQVKIFKQDGSYSHTIGQKGRGPGDLVGPGSIAFSPDGNFWVGEFGGRRFQCFTPSGKSKAIIKYNGIMSWIAITHENELIVYDQRKTVEEMHLLSIYNTDGELLRKVGKYHDPSKNIMGADGLCFSIDSNDNIYAAIITKPVIRRYLPDGRLDMVITFEPPIKPSVKITLNAEGNEIDISGSSNKQSARIIKKNGSIIIENPDYNENSQKIAPCIGIATDNHQNIYLLSTRRQLTKKEVYASAISGDYTSFSYIDRSKVDFNLLENLDALRILVFSPNGKILAETRLATNCDNLYIHGNRLFIIDGLYNQRILEYEMSYEK